MAGVSQHGITQFEQGSHGGGEQQREHASCRQDLRRADLRVCGRDRRVHHREALTLLRGLEALGELCLLYLAQITGVIFPEDIGLLEERALLFLPGRRSDDAGLQFVQLRFCPCELTLERHHLPLRGLDHRRLARRGPFLRFRRLLGRLGLEGRDLAAQCDHVGILLGVAR